ncbi:MAG: tRNA (guanosine(37)-N1)-methyltransferase TrmD [Planctomycetota bacterium]|nr:tRNA (guanosine(37)-N1)-methyltransferase TrmD [Planctomycetota bacterium]
MRFDILTLFPGFFDGILGDSILKRASEAGHIEVEVHNLPKWSNDPKHHKVDDRPYGGGPGMVIKPEPVVDSVEELTAEEPAHVILTTPVGRPYSQPVARELSKKERLVIVCGHYEGFDERIREELEPDEISIGDYVMTGGELAAMVILDSVSRLLPGVLGDPGSSVEDSFTEELLDHAHYTRPEEYRGRRVPEVLLSGDHAKIAEWRHLSAVERTRSRRPDIYERYTSGGRAKPASTDRPNGG